MVALIEIIVDGVKKFGGEIIGGILFVLLMWLFPSFKRLLKKDEVSSEETRQKILEALEANRREVERLKETLKLGELQEHSEAGNELEQNIKYSEKIVSIIRNFLVGDDWKFDFDEKRGNFRFSVSIKSKLKNLRYLIPVRDDSYTVYAISPLEADCDDKSVMNEMADFICRANYGLRNGNFEIDMTDGEIRYKIFVNCDGIIPSEEVIKNSIIIPSMMFERYSPGMLDIMLKVSTAEEAIAKCE